MRSMNTPLCQRIALFACAFACAAARAQTLPILYHVSFKDAVVATQTVTIAQADGLTTISSEFESQLHVFVANHVYSESLSATFRDDGTVERFHSMRQDGPLRTEASGTLLEEEGGLQVIRTDRNGTEIFVVQRQDYDFHSLALYGTAPTNFLPAQNTARILDVAEGRVLPVEIHSSAESMTTPERQHVASTHLVWTCGEFTSHSWHPERHSDLPVRIVRHTGNGEFSFTLQR